MGMILPFAAIFLTPLALGVFFILLKERPMLAIIFVLTSIAVVFVVHAHYRAINEEEVRQWRERNSKSTPPIYYFQFRLIPACFGLVSLPFATYCFLFLA